MTYWIKFTRVTFGDPTSNEVVAISQDGSAPGL